MPSMKLADCETSAWSEINNTFRPANLIKIDENQSQEPVLL